jgi:pyruvate/2-oxoglutarate/acetoin dehydrogenase E1 component
MKKNYVAEIKRSMEYISKDKKTIFIGQAVDVPGNLIYKTLTGISSKKKIETPIFEDTQMGIATGLSLEGFIPINCYPRFDFFILALNQFVNHLDKINHLSSNQFKPFVINRVIVGAKKPINGGLQHTMDYTEAMKKMLKFTDVIELKDSDKIFNSYVSAFRKKKNTLFVEYSEKYVD